MLPLTADTPPLYFPVANDDGGAHSKYGARDHQHIQNVLRYDELHISSQYVQSRPLRSRNALLMTDTELRLMARAATIGDSSCPVKE